MASRVLRSHQIPYAPLGASEHRDRADQAFQKGEYAEAIADYDVVISLDPADAEAYYNRGLAKYHLEHLRGCEGGSPKSPRSGWEGPRRRFDSPYCAAPSGDQIA